MNKTRIKYLYFPIVLVVMAGSIIFAYLFNFDSQPGFNADRAYQDVVTQTEFGFRIPGTGAHEKTVQWIVGELEGSGWDTSVQISTYAGKLIKNIVAKRPGPGDWVILGAHYDTRIYADRDQDPEKHLQPVLGANDGASGVAVLLELARVIPAEVEAEIWLVFFDAEDNGRIEGWDWILGSQAFAQQLTGDPDAVVIVDMIGDAELNIYKEKNSNPVLIDQIWGKAGELGYDDYFINEYKHAILDDHIPFIQLGIPAVDIIDIEYAYYHTTQDTPDKLNPESLRIVGSTILHWLIEYY